MNTLTNSRLSRFRFVLPVGLLAVFAGTCHAHPGHGAEIGGIGWGLAHPFTGLDHVLAALAVGMLAGLWRRASVAAVFLAAGVLGGFAGAKMGAFIGMESAVAVSMLAFGLGLAFHKRVPQTAALALVAMGAGAHGWAHGSEASGTTGITGIFLGTVAIVALGAVGAFVVRRAPRVITSLGAGIATAAIAILAGIL
jgi:urease accessory protein